MLHRFYRLKELASGNPAWQRQLQRLPPPGLARCLVCPDAAFERLALLKDADMPKDPRLATIKRVLTMAAPTWEQLVAEYGLSADVAAVEGGWEESSAWELQHV